MTRESGSKHVKFEGESEDSSSLDKGSEDIINVEREIALKVGHVINHRPSHTHSAHTSEHVRN